ncbi:MAG: stage V sporulation protein D [Actinobacteria bacterium]|nr:stage V sporulation protein D [Actinomycetota bacterium]
MIRENNLKSNRKRIYFLFFLFLVAFGLVIYRLISIQYIYAAKYKNYAEYQQKDEFIINSKRGKILDRNRVELAISLIERTVYANPKLVEDPEREAEILAEMLDLDADEVREKLENRDLGFVYLKRKVSAEKAEAVGELNLPGIYIQNEAERYYPQGTLAASVVGFVGLDGNGLSGVELEYEKFLRGIDGKMVAEKDVFGNIIPGREDVYIAPVDGADVILTIDSQIQYIAEKQLEETVKKYNALRGIAIVMNPRTGEIYSMASYPGFDPNYYEEYQPELYKIQGISFTYEPGSTFKIVNVASALEGGYVESDWEFNLPPSIKVGDKVIKEIFRTYNINYSVKEIIQHSSNVGAVTIALRMGEKAFWESMKKFGFGELTGIDLPGEERGILHNYKTWPASMIGALAIGQSISVTPIQLLRAVCCVANGGYLVTPRIIKEIRLGGNVISSLEGGDFKEVISKETSEKVKEMMLAVVEDGTGTKASIEGIKVCGKTGTAEKVNSNGIGYDEGRVITSFIGFAPYEDPVIATIVVIDEPQGSENEIWGGTVAAPVFREITKFALSRLNNS